MHISPKYGWAALVLALVSLGAGAKDTRLVDAAERRDARAVEALLKQRADVNAPQADGATALHWAAHWDDVESARRLIAAGAQVNAANDYGVTPIVLAATNGSPEMLDMLLDAGASPNTSLPTGESVLMTAVRSRRLLAVQRLLRSGADANATQASQRQTALMWAATAQSVEIAQALLEKGADVNAHSRTGFTPLMFAAREGSIELSRMLLASGAAANASDAAGMTPLLIATVRGHTGLAAFLLDQGAKPDGNLAVAGYTPLHWASVRFENPLSANEVDPPGEWGAITGIPDRNAKLGLIKTLLAHGADIEARTTRPLPVLYKQGSTRAGSTPFFVAAASGDAGVMRLLVANGANPLARAAEGSTPLIAAAGGSAANAIRVTEQDRIEAMKFALETGTDIEAADNKGYRAMHTAASSEFHGIITFLLEKGADLNPITKSRLESEVEKGEPRYVAGQTPLGIVEGTFLGGSYIERPQTAEFLRKLGARSEGRVTLESYMKAFEQKKNQKGQDSQTDKDPAR